MESRAHHYTAGGLCGQYGSEDERASQEKRNLAHMPAVATHDMAGLAWDRACIGLGCVARRQHVHLLFDVDSWQGDTERHM